MDVYKGTGAFSGIAIGKILYYHKSEYQIRQYEITDVREELNVFRQARARVMEQLTELYEKNCTIQESQAELFSGKRICWMERLSSVRLRVSLIIKK